MHQLNLAVQLEPRTDFDSYLAGPNAEAVAAVTAWADRTGDAFLYLFGIPGSGKTHLLQAACKRAVAQDRTAIYLPLGHTDLAPTVFDNLELWDQVALDDVQAIAGDADWERGLFDLYNRLREAGKHLLASAEVPVAELPLTRDDVRSRLGWGPGYRLQVLPEEDCERLLEVAARGRGLVLGSDAIRYIMRRCPREPGYLIALLEEIDSESLRSQRRPTMPLIGRILQAREAARE